MKPLKAYVESVLEAIYSYKVSDDIDVPEALVADKIKDMRMLIVRDLVYAGKPIPLGFYQTVCCHEIKCGSINCSYNGVTYKSPTNQYYVEFPGVDLGIDLPIKYLGNENFSGEYHYLNLNAFKTIEYRKYTAHKKFYTLLIYDGVTRAILDSRTTIGHKFICATSISDDPKDSCGYKSTDAYPIPRTFAHKIEYLTIKHFVETMNLPKDILNDAADRLGIGQQQPQQKQSNE